ncbi:MAG: PEP-CTERM sorting domain-containing protein [bacterium]
MKRILFSLFAGIIFISFNIAKADLIDFEDYANGDALGTVITATNEVTFEVGFLDSFLGDAYVADVGGKVTAFAFDDQPAPSATPGKFFLSDDQYGPSLVLNYYMTFGRPVSNLGLDIYDFRADGGAQAGDRATLTAYSDEFINAVGVAEFIIPNTYLEDGNLVSLSIDQPDQLIRYASLTFSADKGTGIDNIQFDTSSVPEPAICLLLLVGFVGMISVKKKFS